MATREEAHGGLSREEVKCLTCGHKFTTSAGTPRCGKCGKRHIEWLRTGQKYTVRPNKREPGQDSWGI